MWVFALFVALPLIEIALFITIGGWIGLGWSLAVIFGTAALGVAILRNHGLRMERGLRGIGSPLKVLAQGSMTAAAAVLLILPGFLTDTLGLLLLLPPVQLLVMALVARHVTILRPDAGDFAPGTTRRQGPEVIDGEFIELQPDEAPPRRGPSGWTRH